MATLTQNITQAISDFSEIRNAIEDKGLTVPAGTSTSQYPEMVRQLVNPSEIPDPSDSLPLADGQADAGVSEEYARGDHRHPSDPSKADKEELNGYLPLTGGEVSGKVRFADAVYHDNHVTFFGGETTNYLKATSDTGYFVFVCNNKEGVLRGNIVLSDSGIRPGTEGDKDLGTFARPWGSLYVNGIYTNGADRTPAIEALTTTGDGNAFLASDGTYKAVDMSSVTNRLDNLESEMLGAISALEQLENNSI